MLLWTLFFSPPASVIVWSHCYKSVNVFMKRVILLMSTPIKIKWRALSRVTSVHLAASSRRRHAAPAHLHFQRWGIICFLLMGNMLKPRPLPWIKPVLSSHRISSTQPAPRRSAQRHPDSHQRAHVHTWQLLCTNVHFTARGWSVMLELNWSCRRKCFSFTAVLLTLIRFRNATFLFFC